MSSRSKPWFLCFLIRAGICGRLLCLCLLCSPAAQSTYTNTNRPYLQAGHPDGVALLPEPPTSGPELANELDLVRDLVFNRTRKETIQAATTESLIRASNPVEVMLLAFTNEAGQMLTNPGKLTNTYYLLINLMPKLTNDLAITTITNEDQSTTIITNKGSDTLDLIIEPPKQHFKRSRPYRYDGRLLFHQPESNAGYPSSHATRGWLCALLLADLFPDKRKAILEKGWQIGWDRVRLGKHFPSDVWAGRFLAQAIWRELKSNPAFTNDLQKARAEISEQTSQRNH